MTKLIAFAPTTSPELTEYVKNQLEAISNSFPDLEIEQSNEFDARLEYGMYRDRFPAFILFVEPTVRLAALHSKIGNDELIDWIKSNLR